MRVEALPTPSDHIPALLARVKPVYISRTYNFALPEGREAWSADELLDRLARQKGRLLKGGEPDLEGVAKILLSDWVRGRIPFFVSPPERSEELNKEEDKKRKKADRKGKGKAAADDETVLGVKQNLGSIMQNNTFVGDDVRPLEVEEGEEGEEEDVEGEGDSAGAGSEAAEEEEELAWDDVFKGDEVPALNSEALEGKFCGFFFIHQLNDV